MKGYKVKTKLFFDTEFTGLHQNTTLISLGIISECGKKFYAEFTDLDISQVDDWLKENVIKNLTLLKFKEGYSEYNYCTNKPGKIDFMRAKGNIDFVKARLLRWLEQFESVEMWSDCLHYDWVLFLNMFGSAFDLPKKIYYIPFDICALFKMKGIDPDVGREGFVNRENPEWIYDSSVPDEFQNIKHNALWDAVVIRRCYQILIEESKS